MSQQKDSFTTASKGYFTRKPQKIHVAHRRSPSELTTLMIEQLNLSSDGNSSSNSAFLPPPPTVTVHQSPTRSSNHQRTSSDSVQQANTMSPGQYQNSPRSHSRNGSNAGGHSRNNSGHFGHSRRQSLQLNEAKKHAIEEQTKRGVLANNGSSGSSPDTLVSSTNEDYTFPKSSVNKTLSRNSSVSSRTQQFQFPQSGMNNENADVNSDFLTSPRKFKFGSGTSHSRTNSNNLTNKFLHTPTNSISQDQGSSSELLEPFAHKSNQPSISSVTPNNPNQRKSLFAPYLPQANIPKLIEEGRLVVGTLRVNKKNRSDAWVSTDGILDADIYICGSKDRNRALENDLVAVELLCVDDVWGNKKEKEEKKRKKDLGNNQDGFDGDYHNDATINQHFSPRKNSSFNKHSDNNNSSNFAFEELMNKTPPHSKYSEDELPSSQNHHQPLKRKGSLKQRPTQKKNDDVEVEGQSLLLVEEEDINDEFKPLYAGHIVAVLDRIPGQLFTGTLGLLRPSQNSNKDTNNANNNGDTQQPNKKPKIIWFKPTDKKVPLVAIPTEQAPEDFIDNPGLHTNQLYMASIKRWPITSLHPFGTLVGSVGEINDPNTNVECILKNNNFQSDEYLDPNDKTKERKNFVALNIDPAAANDRPVYESSNIAIISENEKLGSDIAVQLEQLDTDRIYLSVHVVDIAEHLESGSNLDKRIRKRSTGVFLPQRTVPLLPKKVEENCSLNIGSKSAVISVHYTINVAQGKIENSKIEESFISPTNVISAENLVEYDYRYGEVAEILQRLRVLGANNKKAQSINDLPLLFKLDDEKVKCSSLDYYFESVSPVFQEIKNKVNNTVAIRIHSDLGASAFLRKQAEPLSTTFYSFMLRVSEYPLIAAELNFESPIDCLQSIYKLKNDELKKIVELMFYKTLNRAKYCVAGKTDEDSMEHFVLNYDLFTHFVSPFKRYADHVVHRQLKSCIKKNDSGEQVSDKNITDLESLKITAEYCNFKKDFAFSAQEQAIHLLVCETINSLSAKFDQVLTLGRVVQVYESSFDVFIPEFGIEKRVHGDQLPLIKAEFDNFSKKLELYWSATSDSATYLPSDEKKPNSFRNSIKNKFKTASKNIADDELTRGFPTLSKELKSKFNEIGLQVPDLFLLKELKKEFELGTDPAIDVFKKRTTTRIEESSGVETIYVQEIKELDVVPVLVRAEIGMALPCLSVRALNPFV
ncbi:hypothetical protein QEN19_001598 [Hanseniaspora menglaensis]